MLDKNFNSENYINTIKADYIDNPQADPQDKQNAMGVMAQYQSLQSHLKSLGEDDPATGKRREITPQDIAVLLSMYQQFSESITNLKESVLYDFNVDALREQTSLEENYLKGIKNPEALDKLKKDPDAPLTITDISDNFSESLARLNALEDAERQKEKSDKNIVEEQATQYAQGHDQLDKHDDVRYMSKAMLATRVAEWGNLLKDYLNTSKDEEVKKDITDLQEIMESIKTYTEADVTAVTNKEDKATPEKDRIDEAKLFDQIIEKLDVLNTTIQSQGLQRAGTDAIYDSITLMTANFGDYFERQRNGNLRPVPDEEITVDATGQSVENIGDFIDDYNINQKKAPLFPHEPSYNDINQGAIGDCYMLASLSAIAQDKENTKKIKDAMVENPDGTVTVRFWQKEMDTIGVAGARDTYKPIYVKVDKITPADGSARNCVWVQTLERAYAVSGLSTHSDGRSDADQYTAPIPSKEKLDEMYKQYKALPEHERPSHVECPWLINSDGELHRYKPTYKNISGGTMGRFIEHFLGPDYGTTEYKISALNETTTANEPLITLKEAFVRIASKDNLFQNQYERTALKTNPQTNDFQEFCYRMLTGSSNSRPVLNNGDSDHKDENTKVADLFAYDMMNYVLKVATPAVNAKKSQDLAQRNAGNPVTPNQLGLDLTGLAQHLNDVAIGKYYALPDPKNLALTEINGKPVDTHLNLRVDVFSNPDLENKYNQLARKLLPELASIKKMYAAHEKYSGTYNGKEKALLKTIKDALDNHKPVTLATNSSPDNSGDVRKLKGMNYQHAYTVTDIVEQDNGSGKKITLLKCRNPHGATGREYSLNKDNKVFCRENPNSKDGECYIELSDVFDECSLVHINGMNKDPLVCKTDNPINAKLISQYDRCLQSACKQLEGATSYMPSHDSKEYRELIDCVKDTRSNLSNTLGKDRKELGLKFINLEKKIKAYRKHCNQNPINNRTRNKRLQATTCLDEIVDLAKGKYMGDPKVVMKYDIAESIATRYLFNRDNKGNENYVPPKNQVERFTDAVLNHKDFKKACGDKNAMELSILKNVKPEKLLAVFQNFCDTLHNKAPQQPQAQNQVQPQAQVQKKQSKAQAII